MLAVYDVANSHKYHRLSIAACIALSFSMFGCEWIFQIAGYHAIKLILRTLAGCILLWLYMQVPHRLHGKNLPLIIAFLVFYGIVASHIIWNAERGDMRLPHWMVHGVLTGVFGAFLAYQIALDRVAIVQVLERAAWLFAGLSLYSYTTRVFLPNGFPSVLIPAWPIRLLILFGFCWHLHRWLCATGVAFTVLAGLLMCSLEILVTFHKPIVFAGCISSAIVVVSCLWRRSGLHIGLRFLCLAVLGAITLVGVNTTTSGRVFEEMDHTIRTKYFHYDPLADWTETVERASGGRFYLWRNAASDIAEHPFFGVGFGSMLDSLDEEGYAHVHNAFLATMLAVGFVGTLAVAVIFVWWLGVVKSCFRSRTSLSTVVPSLGYIAGLAAYNLGGTSYQFVTVTSFGFMIMAVVVALAPTGASQCYVVNQKRSVIRSRAKACSSSTVHCTRN